MRCNWIGSFGTKSCRKTELSILVWHVLSAEFAPDTFAAFRDAFASKLAAKIEVDMESDRHPSRSDGFGSRKNSQQLRMIYVADHFMMFTAFCWKGSTEGTGSICSAVLEASSQSHPRRTWLPAFEGKALIGIARTTWCICTNSSV